MTSRRTTLMLAILLALGTGFLTMNYLGTVRKANAAPETRAIFVASSNIPARVIIDAKMLRRVQRTSADLEPDAISDPKQAIGALALITIPAGATITESKVGRPSSYALPVRLKRGYLAMSISIDKVKGVSGLLQPGDRVDVIAVPPRNNNEPSQAQTILRGVRVLAVGTQLETPSANPSKQEESSTTVTLEVTRAQANVLASADVNATLRLALRPSGEPAPTNNTQPLVYRNGPSVAAPPAASAAAPARMVAAHPQNGQPSSGAVTLIEDDKVIQWSHHDATEAGVGR